jgi:hypothetical protein
MSYEDVRYLSHGTFEAKITEMIYRCWEIRRTCESDADLRRYINAIRATYMVLPTRTKNKARDIPELLDKGVLLSKSAVAHVNPIKRNMIVMSKKYENADKAMERLVEVLDIDNLLVIRDQYTPWNVGMSRDRFNPESDVSPDFKTVVEGYLDEPKLTKRTDKNTTNE